MTKVEKSERFVDVRLAAVKQHKLQKQDLNLKQFDINFKKYIAPQDETKAEKK